MNINNNYINLNKYNQIKDKIIVSAEDKIIPNINKNPNTISKINLNNYYKPQMVDNLNESNLNFD